jgi:hypothetical protein
MILHGNSNRKLVLLAPSAERIPPIFRRPEVDHRRHSTLLDQMQRLRGQVYLQDGAIHASALTEGRHLSELDALSWHLLVVDRDERVRGGARFHEHPGLVVFSDLNASQCPLASHPAWVNPHRIALEAELSFARDLGLPCAELGGWALDDELRGTSEAVRIALVTYAFWQAMGGAICISTATQRNCSASILRRIGGRTLTHNQRELPSYFDPKYNCQMELLRFYSWAPNPRYATWVHQLGLELAQMPVFAPSCSYGWVRPQRHFAASA